MPAGTPQSLPPPGASQASAEQEWLPPPAGGETAPPPKPPNKNWTAEDWTKFFEVAGPIGKFLVEQWRWKVEKDAELEEKSQKHVLRLVFALMAFLGAIIAGVGVLTFYGKVSGDALLFLVGTVTGVLLAIVQRYLFEAEPEESSSFL